MLLVFGQCALFISWHDVRILPHFRCFAPTVEAFPANQPRVDPIPSPMLHLKKGIFTHSPAHPMRIPSLIVDVREAPGFMVRCCAR